MSQPNLSRRVAAGIQDGQEMRLKSTVLPDDSEILLVVPHHRNQDFLGDLEKLRVEATRSTAGIFVQIRDHLEKLGILDNPAPGRYPPLELMPILSARSSTSTSTNCSLSCST